MKIHSKHYSLWLIFPSFIAICMILNPVAAPKLTESYAAEVAQRPLPYARQSDNTDIESSSFYFTASDGVKLAVDLHLPAELSPGQRLPTILHQTRYWRSVDIRFPFNLFVDGRFVLWASWRRYFVERGYAWIDVDVRGTGASFGVWEHSYAQAEVSDGAEIVDWISQQSWSNGAVGAWGVSYAGGAAEFLLVNQHPAVKAAVPMFSPFDVYDDIGFPGGLRSDWYIREWAAGNRNLDNNIVPTESWYERLAARGARPVDGPGARTQLRESFSRRSENLDVELEARDIVFRDDPSPHMETIDQMSPHFFADLINSSGTPIYSYSGWLDGGYQHAAIKRFLSYDNPDNKLLIGPWDHGGDHDASPGKGMNSAFNHRAEILKFFDTHLLGIDTGIDDEPRIHYYTMGAEQWKSSDSWPPEGTLDQTFYLNAEGLLDNQVQGEIPGTYDEFLADRGLGSGEKTRWNALVGPTSDGILYPDRKLVSEQLLSFTTTPLNKAVEVTGHPRVSLHISSDNDDFGLFAYLEDISPDGSVHYITEGALRALHRDSIGSAPPYKDAVAVRSYRRESAMPMVPGQISEFLFDLLPTSYRFEAGHRIRLSLAGTDTDYFAAPGSEPPTIRIHRDAQRSSVLILPLADSR